MDNKSKILIAIFIAIILVSVFLTYKRSFVDKNFEIFTSEEEGSEEISE
jgi:hypothetical protein